MSQFDVHAIKRILTSLSEVRVEKKGQDPKEIQITGVSIAMANKLPSFYPPTDTAFFSRLMILPFESIFYPDEETRADLVNQGVDPSRLHPARPQSEIMADIEAEKAGILRMLIEDYISLRDKHNLRPVESPNSRKLKLHYRATNDILQQFVGELFVKDPEGFVPNDRLEELWREFSGQCRPRMKALRDEIEERWPSIARDSQKVPDGFDRKTKRGLSGIRERTGEENPGYDDYKVTKNMNFVFEDEKREKSVIKDKNDVFCNFATKSKDSGHSGEKPGQEKGPTEWELPEYWSEHDPDGDEQQPGLI